MFSESESDHGQWLAELPFYGNLSLNHSAKLSYHETLRQNIAGHYLSTKTIALIGADCESFGRDNEELQKEKTKLFEARMKLKRKDIGMRQRATNLGEHIAALAKSDCLDLATKLHAAFPREVRDVVYSYLHVPNHDFVHEVVSTTECQGIPSARSLRLSVVLGKLLPHWRSVDFVGPDCARELTEFFYEHTVLHFTYRTPHWMDTSISLISTLLKQDMFGHGILPADFIRSCSLTMRAIAGDYPATHKQVKRLSSLKRCGGTLIFRIDFDGVNMTCRLQLFLFHMAQLGATFYEFKKRGFNIKILLSYKETDSKDRMTDATRIFDMDRKCFMSKMKNWTDALQLVPKAKLDQINSGHMTLREGMVIKDDDDYTLLEHLLLKAREDDRRAETPDIEWFDEWFGDNMLSISDFLKS